VTYMHAYVGCFDSLLAVIRDEDPGSVIVTDCCGIMANMLKVWY